MSIEKDLGRIADALERIAAAHGEVAGPSPKAEKPAAKKEDKPAAKKDDKPAKAKGPSKEEVRKALQDYMAIEGREKAVELLKESADGAENLSQLKEADYPAVIAAIKKASGEEL